MSYQEAIQETVTRAQALRELARHGADVQEFFAECGEKSEYAGKEILSWLGY